MGAQVNRKKDQEKEKDEEVFNIRKEKNQKSFFGSALEPDG